MIAAPNMKSAIKNKKNPKNIAKIRFAFPIFITLVKLSLEYRIWDGTIIVLNSFSIGSFLSSVQKIEPF